MTSVEGTEPPHTLMLINCQNVLSREIIVPIPLSVAQSSSDQPQGMTVTFHRTDIKTKTQMNTKTLGWVTTLIC